MNFDFEKGKDTVLKINSEIIGGVNSIDCKEENSFEKIGSFLSDSPIYGVSSKSYTVVINFDCSDDTESFGTVIESVELVGENKTERYLDCCVKSFEKKILPSGVVCGVLTVGANERIVY